MQLPGRSKTAFSGPLGTKKTTPAAELAARVCFSVRLSDCCGCYPITSSRPACVGPPWPGVIAPALWMSETAASPWLLAISRDFLATVMETLSWTICWLWAEILATESVLMPRSSTPKASGLTRNDGKTIETDIYKPVQPIQGAKASSSAPNRCRQVRTSIQGGHHRTRSRTSPRRRPVHRPTNPGSLSRL